MSRIAHSDDAAGDQNGDEAEVFHDLNLDVLIEEAKRGGDRDERDREEHEHVENLLARAFQHGDF